jgi:hypothetical protein
MSVTDASRLGNGETRRRMRSDNVEPLFGLPTDGAAPRNE